VFDIFKKYHKSVYQGSERLVFYSDSVPEQQFIHHVQYAASRMDISNWFILIVCPADISDYLKIANELHGYDQIPMQSLVYQISDSKSFGSAGYADRSFLCPMPFMAVSNSLDGNVRVCCKSTTLCGNVHQRSLSDIFHGEEYNNMRKEIRNGKVPVGCKVCADVERSNSTSLRLLMLDKYKDILDQEKLDRPDIVDFTVSPSSLCNFKCRICDNKQSTSIYAEDMRFADSKQAMLELRNARVSDLTTRITEIFENPEFNPEFIHILGGEPFLWPKLPSVLKQLIDRDISNQIKLEFNTNGSVYPIFLENILDHFRELEILVSIDDVGTRFELQRGGIWSEIFENLKKFGKLNQRQNITVKLVPTVNIQNLLYLNNVVALANHLGVDIVWWYLENPDYLCIDWITDAVKQRVQSLYKDHPEPELRTMAQRVLMSPPVSGQRFLEYMAKLDYRRDQKFHESHQEICDLMNNHV
jgi:MoaA/NifB/PqqE/SkfB family radical SAM enzyme